MWARLAAAVLLLCGISAQQGKVACKVNPCDSHPCGDKEKCTPSRCGCGHTCTPLCSTPSDCGEDFVCQQQANVDGNCLPHTVCVAKVGEGEVCKDSGQSCMTRACAQGLECVTDHFVPSNPGICRRPMKGCTTRRCGGTYFGARCAVSDNEAMACVAYPGASCSLRGDDEGCVGCCMPDLCAAETCAPSQVCKMREGAAVCVPKTYVCRDKAPCGGGTGLWCKSGEICSDDPDDTCDPLKRDVGCAGCCEKFCCSEKPVCYASSTATREQCTADEYASGVCVERSRCCSTIVCRQNKCECDGDCVRGTFCRPLVGDDGASCLQERVCMPLARKGSTCGGGTLPCFEKRCHDSLTCKKSGAADDAPGTCVVRVCHHKGRCGETTGCGWKNVCIDDPDDGCDPAQGGADCGGCCVPDWCQWNPRPCKVQDRCRINATAQAECASPPCVLDDGRVFEEGDTFRVACNACVCRNGGAACDERSCDNGVCALPDGRLMGAGETTKLDGCNTCVCGPDGGTACTEMHCEPHCSVAQPGLAGPLLPSARQECCARAAAKADNATLGALRCQAAAERQAEEEARKRCHPVWGAGLFGGAERVACCARFRLRCPHERFDCFSSAGRADAASRHAFCCRWHGLSCAEPCATDAGRMTERQRAACCATHGTGCEPRWLAEARATDAASEAALAVLGRVSLRGNVIEAQRNPKRLLARFRLAVLRSVPGVRPADVRVSAVGVLLPGGGVPDERARAAWSGYTPTSWNEELFEEEARMLDGAEAARSSARVLETTATPTAGEKAEGQDVEEKEEEGVFVEYVFFGEEAAARAASFAQQVTSGALVGGDAATPALPVEPMGSGVEVLVAPEVSAGSRGGGDATATVVVVCVVCGVVVLLAAAVAAGLLHLRRSRACAMRGGGVCSLGVAAVHRPSTEPSTEDAERALPADAGKTVEIVDGVSVPPCHSAGTKDVAATCL